MRIHIWGEPGNYPLQAKIAEYGLQEVVIYHGIASHEQIIKEYAGTGVNLIITHTAGSSYALPGKLFEYVGAARPIWAITDDEILREFITRHKLGYLSTHKRREHRRDAAVDRAGSCACRRAAGHRPAWRISRSARCTRQLEKFLMDGEHVPELMRRGSDPLRGRDVPLLPVLAGLLGALATGYLLTVNIPMAFGFLVFLALFCVTVLHPVSLIPGLVILTVFVERALQSVGISAGGRELLNLCGVVNLCLAAAIVFYAMTERMRPFRVPGDAILCVCIWRRCSCPCWSRVDFLMTVRSIVRITAGYCIYLMITQFVTEKRQIDRLVQLLHRWSASFPSPSVSIRSCSRITSFCRAT